MQKMLSFDYLLKKITKEKNKNNKHLFVWTFLWGVLRLEKRRTHFIRQVTE